MSKSSTLAFVAAVAEDGTFETPQSRDVAGMVANRRRSRRQQANETTDVLAAGMAQEPQTPRHVQSLAAFIGSCVGNIVGKEREVIKTSAVAADLHRHILSTTGLNMLPAGAVKDWSGEREGRAKAIVENARKQVRDQVKADAIRKLMLVYKEDGITGKSARDLATSKAHGPAGNKSTLLVKAILDIRDGNRDTLTGKVADKVDADGKTVGEKAAATREHRKAEVTEFGKLKASWRETAQGMYNAWLEADRADAQRVEGEGITDALIALMEKLGIGDAE